MKTLYLAISAVGILLVSVIRPASAICEELLPLSSKDPMTPCITFFSFDSTMITLGVVGSVVGCLFVIFRYLKENDVTK